MKQLSRFLDDHCLLRVGGISHYITQDIQEAHDRHSYALYTGENIGSIVIKKEDNLRAMRCPIRKVIETHSGADKIIRTVTSGKVTTNTPNSALVLTSE